MSRQRKIAVFAFILLAAGCSQSTDEKTISGKIGLHMHYTDILESVRNADTETKVDQKAEENKKDGNEEKSIPSENGIFEKENNVTSDEQKQSTENKSTSGQSSLSSSKGDNDQSISQQEQPKQDTSQTQEKEPTKPVEPVKPKEPEVFVPTCDDTIPAGAYLATREDEICSQIEAEMIQSAIDGKPTFNQYEIEYGSTACGTKYFYIIPKY